MRKLLFLILALLPGGAFAADFNAASFKTALQENAANVAQPVLSEPRTPPAADAISDYMQRRAQQDGRISVLTDGNRIIFVGGRGQGKSAYTETYKYGDVVFLIAGLGDDWAKQEWDRYYAIGKWLAESGFRAVMNPVAMPADLRAAVQDERTKVIVWSGHGSKDGGFYDNKEDRMPADIFDNPGRNLKQLIFSTCYSANMPKVYRIPPGVDFHGWNGTTQTDDLFNYLLSKEWNPKSYGANTY
ncbi:MAG: hypothetical protein GX410_00655 [Elusimicrobia bacterium]|nr:hypothetical protein [Elusimicrobiota bacterium]